MISNNLTQHVQNVNFTPREIECAECLIKHFDSKQIAKKLQLSEHMVRIYISNMKQKTGCSTEIELIEWLAES